MRKSVSPMFAVIVIIFALVVGALYILMKFRVYEAEQAREAAVMQSKAAEMQQKMGDGGGAKMGKMGKMGSMAKSKTGGSATAKTKALPSPGASKAPASSKGPAAPK